MDDKIRVGVGVMIFKKGRILLGKRKGSHGAGEYSIPGGHLEFMESFKDCAKREVKEECDIEIKDIKFQVVANVNKYSPRHDIYIGLIAKWKSGDPKIMEPNRCESWGWYELDNLPTPMFHFCLISLFSFFSGLKDFDLGDYCSDEFDKDVKSWGNNYCKIQRQSNENKNRRGFIG